MERQRPSPEERIAEALATGRAREAAVEVIRAFGNPIRSFLTRVLSSPDDADDAYSLWARDVWKGIRSLRAAPAARVWAYRVAWNAARRLRREAWGRRRERLRSSVAARLAARATSRTPGRVEREASHLEELRRDLSPEDNSLLMLHVDRGFSFGEVAEIMAREGRTIEEAALRQRFSRLRAKLARLARKRGFIV